MKNETRDDVLHAVMRSIAEGVIVWSVPDGVLVSCNEAAARILGVSRTELEGRTLDYPWQLIREDGTSIPKPERGAVAALRSGQAQASTVMGVPRPDGTLAWVRSTSVVLRESDETAPYAIVTTFVDITELRQTSEQSKIVAGRLAEAMAGADVGTWELDLETGHVTRNTRWSEILGYLPAELEPTLSALTSRIHPDDGVAWSTITEHGFQQGAPYVLECRVRHKDGHWHWVQERGKAVELTPDGRSRRVAGVLVDIDARRRTEDALRLALADNERLVVELRDALDNVRKLEGLLPICMYCKSIRDDAGAWSSIETYVTRRANVAFSHGICPVCHVKHFADG
jgi:PAS domain S-box-containing protein